LTVSGLSARQYERKSPAWNDLKATNRNAPILEDNGPRYQRSRQVAKRNKISPGDPLDKDIYDLGAEELAGSPRVPGSLEEALTALERDTSSCCKAMYSPKT